MTHHLPKLSTLLPQKSLASGRDSVVVTTLLLMIPNGWLWCQCIIGAGRVLLLGREYMADPPFLLRSKDGKWRSMNYG